MDRFQQNRNLMKSGFEDRPVSDQDKGIEQPPLEEPYSSSNKVIQLPKVNGDLVVKSNVYDIIMDRKSHREYKDQALTLEELSYLLWTTQSVKEIRGDNYATVRPVASAGARHPFETYLAIENVEGLKKGVYRYLALEHKLLFINEEENMKEKIIAGAVGQNFAGNAAVNFIWSCVPYRGEWRYDKNAHKFMLMDAGHLCHALYIACESIGLGNCAMALYDQKLMDSMIKADGENEFVVYMSPVGKV